MLHCDRDFGQCHMHCHFMLPGLLWPNQSSDEATRDLHLPGLGTLLGRGAIRWLAPVSPEHRLAQEFGLEGEEMPFAALRLAGSGRCGHDDVWICADPVHLRFARDMLILADSSELAIEADEARQLVEALNEHFPRLGVFEASAPDRWHVHLADAPAIRTHPPSEVVGRRIDAFLPEGADGVRWRRHLSEAQVVLHNHAVNRAREEAGRPLINSVWFWGAGTMPASLSPRPAKVLGGTPLAHGLARACGVPDDAGARHFEPAALAAETLILLDQLGRPAHYLDAAAWREALQEIDANWLMPALAALRAGSLSRLTLTGLGDEAQLALTMTRRETWRFWRPPRPLAQLRPLRVPA